MSAHESSLPASLRTLTRLVMGAYGALIMWQSLVPAGTGGAIPHMDKLLHGIVYALLAMGVSVAWPRLSKIYILIGCMALGAVLEVVQGIMALGRTASVWDGLANSVGTVLGLSIVLLFSRKPIS